MMEKYRYGNIKEDDCQAYPSEPLQNLKGNTSSKQKKLLQLMEEKGLKTIIFDEQPHVQCDR